MAVHRCSESRMKLLACLVGLARRDEHEDGDQRDVRCQLDGAETPAEERTNGAQQEVRHQVDRQVARHE